MPHWKQRNNIARSAELVRKGEASWATDETTEAAAMDDAWSWVKQVRAVSDLIEADIASGAITTFDGVRVDATWPAEVPQ